MVSGNQGTSTGSFQNAISWEHENKGSSAEFVGKTHETTAYGKVEKPRQKAAGLFHFSTGPAEISFYKEIKEKQKML